jgi:hypothetical protein
MTESDSDIDFDFFEDLETREEPAPAERARGGRPPGQPPPARPPARGPALTPTLRLIGLIAFAILVIVLLVFWIQSCQSAGKQESYENYMQSVSTVAREEDATGRQLTQALTTPGIRSNELAARIDGLAQRVQQNLTSVEQLKPPGALAEEDVSLLDSLGLRVGGLRSLADTLRRTAGSNDVSSTAVQLSTQAQRLVSSDVVWQDLFRVPSITEMRSQGITGVAVPSSTFVTSPDFGSPAYWTPVVQRITDASTGGTPTGLHGTGIVETKALPSGQVLSQTDENTVTAGTDLGFSVTVQDTGDAQEVRVEVTLTIQQQPSPIVATQTIDVINPGEQKTVTFRNLGQVQFATQTVVKVDVKPVPGEANRANNSAEYPVIFSLG